MKRKIRVLRTTALLIVAAASSAAAAAETAAASWYGSAELSAAVPFDDGGNPGLGAETRLVLESEPEDGVGFRAEGGLRWNYGTASMEAIAFDAGIAAEPVAADLPPGTDLHRAFSLIRHTRELRWGKRTFRSA